MTEDKERIQGLLDDFVLRNEEEIGRVSSENPLLLKSVMDVVDLLSKKYGMGTSETAQKIEEIKEKVQPLEEEKPAEEIQPEPEKKKVIIPFEEGDEFYHVDNKNYKYKIVEIDDEDVYVELPNNAGRVHYDLNIAIEYVNQGVWVMLPKYTRMITPEEKLETVSKIKREEEETEEVTLDDLKLAIKNLKPLAEFDEEVKQEIERLKQRMKDLKKKKS